MIGDTVEFLKNGEFVRGNIAEIFYAERTFAHDEDPLIEGFGVSRIVGDTEYVTYETKVVFV